MKETLPVLTDEQMRSGLSWSNIVYDIPLPKKQRKAALAAAGVDGKASPNDAEKGVAASGPGSNAAPGFRRILNGISGHVRPREMVGVLGASGAGKTTLLNALSARMDQTGELSGEILFQGSRRDPTCWKRQTAFVEQDDAILPVFTVAETLSYAARLRLPDKLFNAEQKRQRVEDTIDMLRLNKCRDTKIGSPSSRGVSGGERKRTAIGIELVSDSSLLMLDEPTSGLDSFAALSVVSNLRDVARQRDLACLMTIHQPSWAVLCLFDRITLLAQGCIYWDGPPREMVSYLANLGFPTPEGTNPGDWAISLAENAERNEEGAKRVQSLIDSWASHNANSNKKTSAESVPVSPASPSPESGEETSKTDAAEARTDSKEGENGFSELTVSATRNKAATMRTEEYKTWPTKWVWELKVLTERNGLQVLRNKEALIGIVAQTTILLIIVGFAFFRLGESQADVLARIGVLFFVPINSSFAVLFPLLAAFPLQRVVMMRERSAGTYRTSSFFLSKVIVEIPNAIAQRLLFYVILYFMIGLKTTAGAFFIYLGINCLQVLTAVGLGLFIGSISKTIDIANILAPLINVIFLLFGGNLLPSPPPWFVWLHWISPLTYAYSALSINEFTGRVFDCGNTTGQCYATGEDVLSQYHLTVFTIGQNCGFLVAITFAFMAVGYLGLRITGHPRFRYI